ncbi:class II fumarate hydratase [Flocculibacter collagenilyticus]|uniref:class II fumarate hydratase n=1 Tax=Flocculibacter collagenilyticus TaxID=2744479 RepID=UPI0018F54569|nr:class II fumarate hydratase [Flocculibacter collagenilyticus]
MTTTSSTTSYRIETDSLGDVKVPKSALYQAQTQRAVDNFNFTPRTMPSLFIMALAYIKQAAAQANGELDCITSSHADLISKACDEILAGNHLDQFPVHVFQTGSGTSSNMNMNEVLASLANQLSGASSKGVNDKGNNQVHPNDHVNYGQSSNDVIPTAVQLSVLLCLQQKLFPALQQLSKTLSTLATQYQAIIKTGRTHLMDAMPLSLGDEFNTWRHQIEESHTRIQSSITRLSELPIGGTAIGTGINSDKRFADCVIKHLQHNTKTELARCSNLASRISSQDPSLEVHGQLKVLATVLMKHANDLRWMNSGPNCGLAEIQLKALQPGSSIMPGKVNPVIPEAISMMCAEVMGNDTTLTIANQSGNFQLNVMLPIICDKLIGSIQLLSDCCNAMADKALSDLNVNEQTLAQQVSRNPILVTALNPIIGYELAAKIAKTAYKDGRSVIDVAEEMTELNKTELERLLSPEKLAKPFDL